MRKFVISEKVANEVVDMLQAYIDRVDADSADSGCMCVLSDCPCSFPIRAALHNFETGLCLFEKTKEKKEAIKPGHNARSATQHRPPGASAS